MQLDERAKISVRRHLGMPAAGIGVQGMTLGLRTVIMGAGQLELYMNVLQLGEASLIMGYPYGAFLIQYGNIVNDVITVTVNGVAYVYTVTSDDVASKAPYQTIATNISRILNSALTGIICASGATQNPMVPPQNLPPVGQVSLLALNNTTFTLSVSGPCATLLYNGNTYPTPQLQLDDGGGDPTLAVNVYGLLPVCDALESAFLNSSQNLSFSEVGSRTTGGATFRADEPAIRAMMLARYRHELGVMLSFYSPDAITGIRRFGIRV